VNHSLVAALAAEQAAIYAYAPVGVHLAGDERDEARSAEAAHRGRRDALVLRLEELRIAPSAAPPAYVLPYPVTDRASALRLAVDVENGVAATWRAALPDTEGADRDTALAALTDAAVRATRWRRIGGITPLTTPFPGRLP
jgi:ferritin-like protein